MSKRVAGASELVSQPVSGSVNESVSPSVSHSFLTGPERTRFHEFAFWRKFCKYSHTHTHTHTKSYINHNKFPLWALRWAC